MCRFRQAKKEFSRVEVIRLGSVETSNSRSLPRQGLVLKVLHLDLDGWPVAELAVQALAVEPRHPPRGRRLELLPRVPADGAAVDQLGLVPPDGAFHHGVVVGGAYAPGASSHVVI